MASNDRNKDVEHFNRWSHTYDHSWIQPYADRVHGEMLDVVAKEIAAPNTVLDVGCGTGRLLSKARALYPSAQLIGVDPAEGMVEIARGQLPSATIYLAAAESLPLADSSVDVVLSSISFHHWSDQLAALREISRVLRSGGCFCLADISMPEWLAKLFRRSKVKSPAAVSQFFNGAGLPVKVQHRTFTRFVFLTLGVKGNPPLSR
jgi:ubiquinone/menaquinone biosynthesis C-methylase UbiE